MKYVYREEVHDTMGGLPINVKAQVLDIYGKVIPGLYAAGEVAGSLDIIGMPRGVVMGRIAGESAAADAVIPRQENSANRSLK